MKKQHIILLCFVFLFFYIMNWFIPLLIGDDLFYTFVYNGQNMFIPLAEDAQRVSSLQDIIISQLNFYFKWGGRFVNNTLSQCFACLGKGIFNVFNTIAILLLLLGTYVCANKGKIKPFRMELFLFLLFIFWALNPLFSTVVLWLVGSFHYLWPAMWLVWFLVPYIRVYYEEKAISRYWFSIGMFVLGIFAGSGNENSSCWILLVLSYFLWRCHKEGKEQSWMYVGFVGLLVGYSMLMFAPGNMARLQWSHAGHILSWNSFGRNLFVYSFILSFESILWYFCLRFIDYYRKHNIQEVSNKDILLLKLVFILSFVMSFCVLFSPVYHFRSGFPGFVQLMIASGIVFRIRLEQGICFWKKVREKLYVTVMVISFTIVSCASFVHYYDHWKYYDMLFKNLEAHRLLPDAQKQVMVVKPFEKWSRFGSILTGYHVLQQHLSEDENYWANVTFARYYKIGGIRIDKSKK